MLSKFWDPCAEDLSFASGEDGWEGLPLILHGHQVDSEDVADDELMHRDLLEFILNHEEIQFFLVDREFHICRRHSAARSILRRRLIPGGFRCPVEGEGCPFGVISKAARGAGIRIRLRVLPNNPRVD
ncbi:MAG: hypothetical protein AAGF12_01140 [Myxococcota bacterium]